MSAWAWASMVVLISVSFYPADRFPLSVIVTGLVATAYLIRRRRIHTGQPRRDLQHS